MMSKLVLKRLTASDLTFFEWHFRNRNAGNQKAINLNADVFKDQLYPSVDAIARGRQNKLGIDLWIAGPAGAEPVNLQRKIIKGPAYKNWRLDGELVYNPHDSPARFNGLRPDDIALFAFEGDLAPDSVTLVLVASTEAEDQPLFRGLDGVLGGRRMTRIDVQGLRTLCEDLQVSTAHPVWRVVTDEDLVEAAAGVAPAIERLLRRPASAGLSPETLRKARQAAEEIGRLGEQLVDIQLRCWRQAGEIADYEWVSAVNAIAPYDFRVQRDDAWEKLEIKTTRGAFNREYHLPHSELQDMVRSTEPYKIGRVYEATPEEAKMRISTDLRAFGTTIFNVLSGLPEGVTPDGVAIAPDVGVFEDEIVLQAPGDDEE